MPSTADAAFSVLSMRLAWTKPVLREFLEQEYFERYLVIGQKENRERRYLLYNARQELVC